MSGRGGQCGDGCGGMASPCVQPPMSPSPPMRKSGGCLGPWLGWFSPGAMVHFRGDPSVSVFCVGLPGKGSRQCRERGGIPLIPTTPQTTTTLALPPLTLSIFPICAPGVEVGAQHAAPLPPPDPTCTHTMGKSGSELLGTRHPAPPSRFSQICPLL